MEVAARPTAETANSRGAGRPGSTNLDTKRGTTRPELSWKGWEQDTLHGSFQQMQQG